MRRCGDCSKRKADCQFERINRGTQFSQRCRDCRNILVRQFLPLAHRLTREAWDNCPWMRNRRERDDVLQDAMHGLVHAADCWRSDHLCNGRPVTFKTYAYTAVRNWIYREAQVAGIIRIPQNRKIAEWGSIPASVVLDLPEYTNSDGNMVPMDVPDRFHSEPNADAQEMLAEVRRLPERERQMVVLYYGLDDGVQRTLSEVGKLFGISKERVRQVICKAFFRLGWDLCRRWRRENGDRMSLHLRAWVSRQRKLAMAR